MRLGLLGWACLWLMMTGAERVTAACGAGPAWRGVIEGTVNVDGKERSYLMYVPSGYDGATALPLLLVFHGFGSSPENIMALSDFNTLAEAEGFLVVYPRASEQPATWYNGVGLLRPVDDARDLRFVDELLQAVQNQWCVDPQRVYAVGFSMGGGMAYRLACERAERFAAFGTVAGAFATIPGGCTPQRPMPVMAIHGLLDRVVPFEGVRWLLPSVSDWVAQWAARNQCAPQPVLPPFTEGVRFSECAEGVEVVLVTAPQAGHTWPGTPRPNRASRLGGQDDGSVAATPLLWGFLSRYTLP